MPPRLLILIALTTLGLIGYVALRAETNPDARGCRHSGGTWHPTQQTCTWPPR